MKTTKQVDLTCFRENGHIGITLYFSSIKYYIDAYIPSQKRYIPSSISCIDWQNMVLTIREIENIKIGENIVLSFKEYNDKGATVKKVHIKITDKTDDTFSFTHTEENIIMKEIAFDTIVFHVRGNNG